MIFFDFQNELKQLSLRLALTESLLNIWCQYHISMEYHFGHEMDRNHIIQKLEKIGFLMLSLANTAAVSIMPRSAIVHAEPLEEMRFLVDAAHQIQTSKKFFDRKAGTVMNILEQMERRDRGFQEVLE